MIKDQDALIELQTLINNKNKEKNKKFEMDDVKKFNSFELINRYNIISFNDNLKVNL